MTGDGVNDSPALKSCGYRRSHGAKRYGCGQDAADVILLDDNLPPLSMPSAKEGVYIATYKKVIQFLLAGNIAEILVLFIATVLNWEPPILAVHILLINLATDSLPAIALGVDPADANIMHEPPVRSGTLFERGLIRRVILHGLFIAGSTMAISYRAEPGRLYGRGYDGVLCLGHFSSFIRSISVPM